AYKYCKQKKIEKTPIIQYNEKNLTTFAEKSEAFLAALLPANSANNIAASTNLANSTAAAVDYTDNYSASHSNPDDNQWKWPELTEKELENTILISSNKSVPGPD